MKPLLIERYQTIEETFIKLCEVLERKYGTKEYYQHLTERERSVHDKLTETLRKMEDA